MPLEASSASSGNSGCASSGSSSTCAAGWCSPSFSAQPPGNRDPRPTLLIWHTHSAHMANNKQHMALHGTLHHQIQVLMTHNEHLLFGTQCQTVIAAHPQRLLIWQTILNTTHIAHMTWHTKKTHWHTLSNSYNTQHKMIL